MELSLHQLALGSLRGINMRLATEIIARVGSEENFFNATRWQLASMLGFDSRILDDEIRKDALEQARKELVFIEANRVRTSYFQGDPSFPERLTDCEDAPVLLYGLGDCDLNAKRMIAIVGTRHATPYGVNFIREFMRELAVQHPDTVIVSGLAYGIDVTAHHEALANGMPTVAVLAHGLSTVYPSSHRNIAVEMVRKNGMLLTDYPHDARLHRANFIARNRIVAGLSDCTLVVESDLKGGALITANIAVGYSRDLFALPGRTSDIYSRGCNKLIADNKASLVTCCDDLLAAMNWSNEKRPEPQKEIKWELGPEESLIVNYLRSHGEGQLNRMAVELDIRMHRLMGLLVDMEFKGIVIAYPGAVYRLA